MPRSRTRDADVVLKPDRHPHGKRVAVDDPLDGSQVGTGEPVGRRTIRGEECRQEADRKAKQMGAESKHPRVTSPSAGPPQGLYS